MRIKMIYLQSMNRLIDDIGAFLESNGFEFSYQIRYDFNVISVRTSDEKRTLIILPVEIKASSPEEARLFSMGVWSCITSITVLEGYPIIIPEDRWKRQKNMMQARLLAHLELFSQAYARNCEVRRIDKNAARKFLSDNHSYGYAACKYHYGLFLKRHTGHIAREMKMLKAGCSDESSSFHSERSEDYLPSDLIAVATFSNARKWIKNGKEIRSYEWTRYASLPDLRVSGGMGKLLKAFIKEIQPDDIMSYADLEWSEGRVYKALGFTEEMSKEPVDFEINPLTWERIPIRCGMTLKQEGTTADIEGGGTFAGPTGNLYYRNFGSRKLRLKLTDYR